MTEPEREEDLPKMSLGEHLEELRWRLIKAAAGFAVAMVVSLALGTHILRWIQIPYIEAMRQLGREPELAVLKVGGAFSVWMTVSVYAGLVLASPWVFYQLWMFVAAGLYRRERRYVVTAVPFSAFLFMAGAAFAMLIAIPAIKFFVWFDGELGVKPVITLPDYVSFVVELMLVMGLVFQMPLLVLILARVGIVTMAMLRRYRKHVVVGIATFCAIFAPPDVLSMFAMMAPMWLLYELGVVLANVLVFRKRSAQDVQ